MKPQQELWSAAVAAAATQVLVSATAAPLAIM
jgi:hypothetical protein